MSHFIVCVTARQAGLTDPIDRHYRVEAKTREDALVQVRGWKPYPHPVHPGVLCGHMPGSTFAVTGDRL